MPRTAAAVNDEYYDLGSFHRPTSTGVDMAQHWFDRGLVWAYAFNHDEAIACFEQALHHDSALAVARWGIAYAIGPNYNKGWDAFDPRDRQISLRRARAELARARTSSGSEVEMALVDALSLRYPTDDPDDEAALAAGMADYADAMTALAAARPDDADVSTLAADALINLTAWQLWDTGTGDPAPGSRVVDALALLDQVLSTPQGREHPGALHFYIHVMEMSAHPEHALPAADALRDLVPDAGHLRHMPSHIDVLCGEYHPAVQANLAAVEADRRFVEARGPLNFYSLYRAHDLHFAVYAAMFAGQSRLALAAAEELHDQLTPEVLSVASPPMADWLEAFVPLRVHVLIRFGRWEDLIAQPLPTDSVLYCTTTATIHYGRAMGYAATGRLDQARREQRSFEAAYSRIPESRTLFNNTARDILAVGSAMLDGEIAYRAGDFERAFAHLRTAIERDDSLPYDEPWGWMQPTRHALGALLLEQGRVAEAAEVYAADLGLDPTLARPCRHPNNVWSLHGYHECLVRLGRQAEAHIIAGQLELARARADVAIEASCACRLEVFDVGAVAESGREADAAAPGEGDPAEPEPPACCAR